jgi:hypothetical protein
MKVFVCPSPDEIGKIGFEPLLDVDCDNGRFLFEIQRQNPRKILVDIDLSIKSIEYAKAINQSIRWIQRSIRKEK